MARGEETAEASNARRFADLLFEIVHKIGLGRFERRAETEEDGGEQAKQKRHREDGDARCKVDHEGKVHVVEQSGERMEQEIVAPDAKNKTDHAAADVEQ